MQEIEQRDAGNASRLGLVVFGSPPGTSLPVVLAPDQSGKTVGPLARRFLLSTQPLVDDLEGKISLLKLVARLTSSELDALTYPAATATIGHYLFHKGPVGLSSGVVLIERTEARQFAPPPPGGVTTFR